MNKLFVPSNLALGDILELYCTVKRGEPPLTFRWLYNGRDIAKSKHLVTTLGSSSHLSIGKIESDDVGNYTCIVSNAVGNSEVTANIVIEGRKTNDFVYSQLIACYITFRETLFSFKNEIVIFVDIQYDLSKLFSSLYLIGLL